MGKDRVFDGILVELFLRERNSEICYEKEVLLLFKMTAYFAFLQHIKMAKNVNDYFLCKEVQILIIIQIL
jgi:hypothetical protein